MRFRTSSWAGRRSCVSCETDVESVRRKSIRRHNHQYSADGSCKSFVKHTFFTNNSLKTKQHHVAQKCDIYFCSVCFWRYNKRFFLVIVSNKFLPVGKRPYRIRLTQSAVITIHKGNDGRLYLYYSQICFESVVWWPVNSPLEHFLKKSTKIFFFSF